MFFGEGELERPRVMADHSVGEPAAFEGAGPRHRMIGHHGFAELIFKQGPDWVVTLLIQG